MKTALLHLSLRLRASVARHTPRLGVLALFAIAMLSAAPVFAGVIYVVPGGAGTKDGSSWANAQDLAAALPAAPSGSELWVKSGTYKPAGPNGDRNATFQLMSGVAVYGGFAGTEMARTQRNPNPATNGTILSGDLNGDDATGGSNIENSYHVVTGSGTDATAALDGFTISGANANGNIPQDRGGGMFNNAGSSTLSNVTLSGNSAVYGGGMYNYNSSPTLTNVTFSGNSAGNNGGGMYDEGGSVPTLANVTFSGNSAATTGGGMFNNGGNPTLTNLTFSGNSASQAGGMYNANASPAIRNSILWSDSGGEIVNDPNSTPTVTYSLVQGSGGSGSNWNGNAGNDGGHNLDKDPLFATPITAPAPTTTGNLRLTAGSPAINAGDQTVTNPSLPATDLDGNPRVIGANVDLGAYELFLPPTLTNSALSVTVGSTPPLNLATATGASAPPTGGTGVFSGMGAAQAAVMLVNGQWVFDPTLVAPGVYTLIYTVTDSHDASNSATFTVAVITPWAATASLATARFHHTATLLPNGQVLVVGGYNGGLLASAELYDPASGTWTATGSLATARDDHTATLLSNGKVLVAGGSGNSGYLASAELYDPASGTWTATGSLVTGRESHTAMLLPNGQVLVAGGEDSDGDILASAELYDPAGNGGAGTWTATGSLATARRVHTATLLPNGQVLVAGGANNNGYLATAELYDPASEMWTATGSLLTARALHTATLLPNGKVLVAGGEGNGILASAELYDLAGNGGMGTWTATGSFATAPASHTATLLPNGQVLVAGGFDSGALASAELYDPASGMWTVTGSLATARVDHTATLLPNGQVLVAAGYNNNTGALASAELYDPASGSGSWTATGSLTEPREYQTATLLPNGKVLLAAGGGNGGYLASAELYDPASATSAATGSLVAGRNLHTATLLPNGQVLVAGGHGNDGFLASAELYDSAGNGGAGMWTATGSLATGRYEHTATLLPNGKVLVAGGFNSDANPSYLTSAELYDPASGTWTPTGSLTEPHEFPTATLLPNGKVLVAGGAGYSGGFLASAELYDPASGKWTATGSLTTARFEHTATLLPNGQVLVAGGYGNGRLASAELYDPASGKWTATGSLATARNGHTATLLPNGRVLVAGGISDGGRLASAELYDPASGTWTGTGSLATARFWDTATLLPNGRVLVAGGIGTGNSVLASAELYALRRGFLPAWQPQITSASFNATGELVLAGSGFDGISGGSGGGTQESPANYPVVQLHWLDNEQSVFLPSDPATLTSATAFTSAQGAALRSGYALATVYANGIPSAAVLVASHIPPTAPNGVTTGTAGTPQTYALSFPATDADGDPVMLTGATAVTGLSVGSFDASAGTVTFTPNSNFTGNASFTYTVDDGSGVANATATGTITVTVSPAFTNPTGGRAVYLLAGQLDLSTGVTPGGGMFSGAGVTAAGMFTPATAGLGPHSITYTVNGESSTITLTVAIVPYDFNGDGTSDLLLFNPGSMQTTQWNLHGPSFVSSATGPNVPAGWMVLAAADFNGDSQPDLVLFKASTRQTAIWYMNGAAHASGVYGPTLPAGWSLVGVADFDGDGHPDYLLFNASTGQTMIDYLHGPALVSSVSGPTLPAGWELVGTGDFDKDGHPDFLLFNPGTNQTVIWYMNGAVHLHSVYGPTLPAGWAVDGIADFNGDGHPDYLLFNASTNQMAIWFLNGATHMGGTFVPTLPLGWTVEAVADFNGDHQPDYLLVNDATGQTAVWYGDGPPFVQAANSPAVQPGWALVAAADFNGDGQPDYLLFNASTGQTALWYMDGATRLSEVYGPTVGAAGWALVGAADFNGDGHPDFLFFNASTGQTAIWYMNGPNVLSEVYGPTVKVAGWALVGAADFNGDGHPDFLFFDASTGQTAIWYMNGPNVLSEVYGPTLPAGWSLAGSADFNVDGQPDYLLFNASTHQSAIWYMNGPAHAGGAFGPTVPTGWSLIAH